MNMLSPTLGEFYTSMSSKFPTLFEEISKSLQNPQKVRKDIQTISDKKELMYAKHTCIH